MHSFGDAVKYQIGDKTVNALVVQSQPQADGENLTLVYLDPAAARPFMTGLQAQQAIKTAFAAPLADGRTYGWSELASIDDAAALHIAMEAAATLTDENEQLRAKLAAIEASAQPSAADLDAHAEEQKAAEDTVAAQEPVPSQAELPPTES